MVLNNIEKLIEKYNNAETTLAEEAQLRAYFTGNDVAQHLEHYKPMFVYFSQAQQEQYTKDVPLKPKKTKMYQWISVAAVAVLMLGFIIPQVLGPSQEEIRQKELAMETYNKTMEALSLVSIGMNEGKEQLNSLTLVSDNLNQGFEEVSRLNEFSKATNRIFKNK
ncbi:MAG: hypothetical protein CMC05_05050 [Flavobacteriaceae bacterium]|nr:hypothetical protein [Flavobacteriaceae bacterium]MBD10206.1 hypothetical protein [Flavobacteriaceae bacterium]|tara:strand:- start:1573 stop:2067 length:495 start_codon:yes stop_codon:yes gene_type:complete